MKFEIRTIYDDYDCEDCGGSYAEGFVVTEEGNPLPIINLIPLAHCYDGTNFDEKDALAHILKYLGHEVTLDGNPYFES